MRLGIIVLILAYGLSQFYRAFLAVLAPVLETDLGIGKEELASASGLWFLVFAAMQIPVGSALDRIGPRTTTAILLAIGGAGGATLFGLATQSWHISLAMALIGIGCSPVLMASYYIFARVYTPAVFGTLAGLTIGFGSIGNIASSAPMAWAVESFGWREAMFGLAGLTLISAVLIQFFVKDPARVETASRGSILGILKFKQLWPIFALISVNYVPSGAIRGLWAGPYFSDVFGASASAIGTVTLIMGLAMIAGNFAYGPADRIFGTRKWVVFWGNTACALACYVLFLFPSSSMVVATVSIAAIGFFGVSYPLMVAHGRSFIPEHLVGRGVTLLNLFSIGTVGIVQTATRPIAESFFAMAQSPAQAYGWLFGLFGVILTVGLVAYLFAKDRLD